MQLGMRSWPAAQPCGGGACNARLCLEAVVGGAAPLQCSASLPLRTGCTACDSWGLTAVCLVRMCAVMLLHHIACNAAKLCLRTYCFDIGHTRYGCGWLAGFSAVNWLLMQALLFRAARMGPHFVASNSSCLLV